MNLDPKAATAGILCAGLLAGCVATSGPTDLRGETGATGNINEVVAAQDLVGTWILADNAERECQVELSSDMPTGATMRSAVATRECDNSMGNVAGWDLADGRIILFDQTARQIGLFEAATTYRYQGEFTLTTGVANPATFVRGA